MKLRNKKTGEIGYLRSINWNETALIVMDKDGVQLARCTSLAELNEEWKDYEEPEEYCYIDIDGEIDSGDMEDGTVKAMKEIGNYFSSREEAEKAVEKLKAWKRLKEKGFRFTGVEDVPRIIRFEIPYRAGYDSCEAEADLDLLFGGEE